MLLGNGLVETTDYNTRLQPCLLSAGTAPLLQLSLRYGASDQGCDNVTGNNGNIVAQAIVATGNPGLSVMQTYSYDALNRLESVTEGGWSRVYEYDRWGNRAVTGDGLGLAQPGSLGAFDAATNRLTTDWAKYDAAGNLEHFKFPQQSALDWTAAYDGENKQRYFCADTSTACGPGNATAEYRYDGEGRRVRKLTASEAITYVYDAFGRLAAEYSTKAPAGPGGRYFRTTDHLGSTRLVTDGAGAVVSRRDYFPFGEEIPANATFNNRHLVAGYTQAVPSSQKFTGKERDAESGLDYLEARYFSGAQGRFTSPDAPLVDQDPLGPQSWNLYSYVRNSPLLFTDPTGRRCVKTDGGSYGDDGRGEGCEAEGVDPSGRIKSQQVEVIDTAPPSPELLALALGMQRAGPLVNTAAVGTAVVMTGGFASMGYGALAGGTGLVRLGVAAGPAFSLLPRLQDVLNSAQRLVVCVTRFAYYAAPCGRA